MTTATTAPTLKVLGSNDEQTTCDRCGRMELRGTVILGDENGEVGRYGTTCAGYMLDPAGKTKITRDLAQRIEAIRRSNVCSDIRAARKALARRDERNKYGSPGYVEACWIVANLERETLLHRDDEIKAVADIREAARVMRAELRAAGKL